MATDMEAVIADVVVHAGEAERGECTCAMSEHWPAILTALQAAKAYVDALEAYDAAVANRDRKGIVEATKRVKEAVAALVRAMKGETL